MMGIHDGNSCTGGGVSNLDTNKMPHFEHHGFSHSMLSFFTFNSHLRIQGMCAYSVQFKFVLLHVQLICRHGVAGTPSATKLGG